MKCSTSQVEVNKRCNIFLLAIIVNVRVESKSNFSKLHFYGKKGMQERKHVMPKILF